MPGSVYHQLTATTPDDPAYEIRPSHFNQSHLVTINATGSEISNAFSNANGISFGLSAGAITGSYTVPSVPSVTEYFSKTNTTFNGANISGSITNNTNGFQISLSVAPPGGGAADGVNIIAAGTQTANTTGTVLFDNANGVSFGMNNSSVVTASHNALTSQSNQNVTAANGGFAFQTLSFSNLNGISFGTSAGSAITASHNALTTARASNDAIGLNTALTAGPLAWTVNSSGLSLNAGSAAGTTSGFAGNLISGSMTHNTAGLNLSVNHPAWLTTAMASNAATISNIRVSAGTTSNLLSALTFADGNGISFGLDASTLTASYTRPVISNAIQSVGSVTGSGTNTSRFAADDHVHAGVFSLGVSTAGNTIGDTRVDVGRFVLQGGNNVTLSQITAANALNTIVVSGANTGAAAITQSIGMSTQTAGGATGGTTGYATGDDVLYHFVPGSNITMSQSVNGASATLSIYGPAAGGGGTLSGYAPYPDREIIGHTYGAGTVVLDPESWPAFQCDRIVFPIVNTNSSNSSGSHSISFHWGMYTRNNSTLSLLISTSSSTAVTHSGTAGSYSLYSGIRNITIPFTTTFTAGDYWVAYMSRTTSGGANGSYSNMCVSNVASAFNGFFGSSHNTTYQLTLGQGVYTVSSSSLPGSIAFTQIRGSDSAALRFPKVFFASGTI